MKEKAATTGNPEHMLLQRDTASSGKNNTLSLVAKSHLQAKWAPSTKGLLCGAVFGYGPVGVGGG